MLINLSNHPHTKWSVSQLEQAQNRFGTIVHYGFPRIDPEWDMAQVRDQVDEVLQDISAKFEKEPYEILVAGEQSFIIDFVKKCESKNIKCYVATSERMVKLNEDGSKNITFHFVKFRQLCV